MKLYLSGGGSGDKSIEIDTMFAKEVGDKPLLYIPIAIIAHDPSRFTPESCFQWISNAFNPLGIKQIEMWLEKDLREKTDEDLKRFGGIYIGGGNTFYLMKELRDSGFADQLVKFANGGMPIAGGSAGTIIWAKTIVPAIPYDPNTVGMTDMRGFDMIHGYDVWCHYVPEMDGITKEYIDKYSLKLAILPDDGGLFVTEEKIEEVGKGKVRYTN